MIPSIDVVIPVHDHWDLTKSCLEHLRRQTVTHTVIVCDAGSTDGTPERLRSSYPEAQVIEMGANIGIEPNPGFAATCNRGVRAGTGDIVVLMNNDVDCRPDFLERLIAPFELDDYVGSVAALLLEPGEHRIESFGLTSDRTLSGFPRLRGTAVEAADDLTPTLTGPSAAAGAYLRRAWDEVGGLDEGVVLYSEDLDLALQLRGAGWGTAPASDAVAIHIGSAVATRRSAWQRYQSGFARGYFLRRYRALRSKAALRVVVTEAVVVVADALVFSRDLAAFKGRLAGWRAGSGRAPKRWPPEESIDYRITFIASLRLRMTVFRKQNP